MGEQNQDDGAYSVLVSDYFAAGPVVPERPGRVIVLNGASSSGKSSIAAALRLLLSGSWYVMALDAFHTMRDDQFLAEDEEQQVLDRACLGFHRAVAGMLQAGNDVIVDYVFGQDWRRRDLLAVLPLEQVVLVGVHCELPELERRERKRGDRPRGLAAYQLNRVSAHGVHDIDIDTTHCSPHEAAQTIANSLSKPPTNWAAARRLGAGDGSQSLPQG
jgi:chloramphenicol 3-O phosphotransferase